MGAGLRGDDAALSLGLRRLGEALHRRADEVVALQRSFVRSIDLSPMDDAKACAAVRSLARLLMTGRRTVTDDIDALVDSGSQQMANLEMSVGTATRLCLAWRDAVIHVLRDEGARLAIAPDTLECSLAAARASHDAFIVLMGDSFDAQRSVIQAALNARTAELAYAAFHDPLTGLANRAQFFDALSRDCSSPMPGAGAPAVVYVDLDGFKAVNDALGHQVGDALLVEAAQRLTGIIRPNDLLARLGGDEFVVLCRNVTEDPQRVANILADRIRAALAVPFDLAGERLSVTASAGIAVQVPGQGSAEQLLASADAAMYCEKHARRRHEYAAT